MSEINVILANVDVTSRAVCWFYCTAQSVEVPLFCWTKYRGNAFLSRVDWGSLYAGASIQWGIVHLMQLRQADECNFFCLDNHVNVFNSVVALWLFYCSSKQKTKANGEKLLFATMIKQPERLIHYFNMRRIYKMHLHKIASRTLNLVYNVIFSCNFFWQNNFLNL